MTRADVTSAFILTSSLAVLASAQVRRDSCHGPDVGTGSFRIIYPAPSWHFSSRGARLHWHLDRARRHKTPGSTYRGPPRGMCGMFGQI